MIFVILIRPAHYWDLPSLILTFNWLEQMLDSSQMIKTFLRLMIEICKKISKVQASKKIYNNPSPFLKKITRWRIIWETLINRKQWKSFTDSRNFDHPEQIFKRYQSNIIIFQADEQTDFIYLHWLQLLITYFWLTDWLYTKILTIWNI